MLEQREEAAISAECVSRARMSIWICSPVQLLDLHQPGVLPCQEHRKISNCFGARLR
jgi:hypothetical protein